MLGAGAPHLVNVGVVTDRQRDIVRAKQRQQPFNGFRVRDIIGVEQVNVVARGQRQAPGDVGRAAGGGSADDLNTGKSLAKVGKDPFDCAEGAIFRRIVDNNQLEGVVRLTGQTSQRLDDEPFVVVGGYHGGDERPVVHFRPSRNVSLL